MRACSCQRVSVERVVHGGAAWRQCQLGSISEAAYWAAVAEELRLPIANLPQFRADYFAADALDHEAIAQLRRIRASGTAVALLSNESRSLPARLTQLGIIDLFSPLLVSAYLGIMKPDPRAFHAALALLDLPPAQVVFVDDLAANVEAAAALGIQAIQYRAGMSLAEMLTANFPTPALGTAGGAFGWFHARPPRGTGVCITQRARRRPKSAPHSPA